MREEEREDGRGDDPEGGPGGNGEVAVAKSSVAISSLLTTGFPQEEQKRTFPESSVPQNAQFTIGISRYRILQIAVRTSAAADGSEPEV